MRTLYRLALVLCLALSLAAADKETPLDRYIKAPDSSYKWEVNSSFPGEGYKAFVIDLTSQTWKTPVEPDRMVWKHWLTVIVPDQVKYSTGFLMIGGGSNRDKPPARVDPASAEMAVTTNSVVAELRQVPNQPLKFPDEPKEFVEDAFIAYTWDKFLRTGDTIWPARLPMTKSAVRAMDSITAFMASEAGGKHKVDTFMVAGGSKRGWTTWTTAAVDKRVVAIAPIVIDMLNVEPSFVHHFRAYGFYAPAVHDYEERGIMKWQNSSEYRALMKIVEPYEYRDRLTIPKYIVNSAGDQFFLPDSSQFYFDDLKGEKHLRYVANTDHSLRNSDARQGLLAFYNSVLQKQARPRYSWKFERDGSIRVTAQDKPSDVKLWQATNPDKRDFRLMTLGQAYKSSELKPEKDGLWIAQVPKPDKGWTAFFVELTFASGTKYPHKLSTGIRVTPDTLPFAAPKFEKPAK